MVHSLGIFVRKVENLEQGTEKEVKALLQRRWVNLSDVERNDQVLQLASHLITRRQLSPPLMNLLKIVYEEADADTKRKLTMPNSRTSTALKAVLGQPDKKNPRDQDQEASQAMQEIWPDGSCGVPSHLRQGLLAKGVKTQLRALYNSVKKLGYDPESTCWGPGGILSQACNQTSTFSGYTVQKTRKNLEGLLANFPRSEPDFIPDLVAVDHDDAHVETHEKEEEGLHLIDGHDDPRADINDTSIHEQVDTANHFETPSPQRARRAPSPLSDPALSDISDDDLGLCDDLDDLDGEVTLSSQQQIWGTNLTTSQPKFNSTLPSIKEEDPRIDLTAPAQCATSVSQTPSQRKAATANLGHSVAPNERPMAKSTPNPHSPTLSADVSQRLKRRRMDTGLESSNPNAKPSTTEIHPQEVIEVRDNDSRVDTTATWADTKTQESLDRLADEQCLNSETIDRLVSYAMYENNLLVDARGILALEKGQDKVHQSTQGSDNVPNCIVLPYESGGHWVCALVDTQRCVIEIINSLSSMDRMYPELIEHAKRLGAIYAPPARSNQARSDIQIDSWQVQYLDCPQQENGTDCGVFVVACCWYRLHSKSLPKTFDGRLLRQVFHRLLGGQDSHAIDSTGTEGPLSNYAKMTLGELRDQCLASMGVRQTIRDIIVQHADDLRKIGSDLATARQALKIWNETMHKFQDQNNTERANAVREHFEREEREVKKLENSYRSKVSNGITQASSQLAIEYCGNPHKLYEEFRGRFQHELFANKQAKEDLEAQQAAIKAELQQLDSHETEIWEMWQEVARSSTQMRKEGMNA